MDRPNYFQTALSNFATDAACGGAIRHLTDLGYTLDQIVERLSYPAPRTKVQQMMMEYLYESRVLLREEPSAALYDKKEEFVQEQDAYGRRTLRRIVSDCNGQFETTSMPDSTKMSQNEKGLNKREIFWRESVYDDRRDGKLTELLYRKCRQNGETFSYISCTFGFSKIDRNGFSASEERDVVKETDLSSLNNRQREYIHGIIWEKPVVYHRLNQRMLEIVGKLYEAGVYGGTCFFMKSGEKIKITACKRG